MMQTLGLAAVAEKSLILVDASGVQILEVSSGLDAIVTLLALTCAVVFIRSSPLWQKIVIVPSAVPIALALNILRVTLAAVLYKVFGNSAADVFFHYLAGWAMIPAALAMLWMECWVLDRLICETDSRVRPLWSFRLAPSHASTEANAEVSMTT